MLPDPKEHGQVSRTPVTAGSRTLKLLRHGADTTPEGQRFDRMVSDVAVV